MADGSQPTAPTRAAGIMFEDPAGRVLLMRRASPDNRWAFPGGHIEDSDHDAESAARRECREETGYDYTGPLKEWTRRIADNGPGDSADFRSYSAAQCPPFTPTLDAEHSEFQWIDRRDALKLPDLHPGLPIALLRADMDELAVAKAIRDGELAGPIQYVNMVLIALRITGTGAAYRTETEEFCWRDPSIYLNDTFVQRCNGLPVILDHPQKPDGEPAEFLSSDEYAKRNVGTIFLPYIKGDEVWGIAKIYDMPTAELLCVKQISTSPCVVFRRADVGSRYELDDGNRLLIEGKPLLLDHVALCELGVWDKGGPPSGVANDNTDDELEPRADSVKEPKMDDPVVPAADASVENTAGGDKLDQILKGMGDMQVSTNALHAKHDAMCSRMDAIEAKQNGSGTIPPKVEPAVGTTGMPDAEAQPGDEGGKGAIEALAKEREENHLAINDAVTKATRPLLDQLAMLNARIPIELPADERAKFASHQMSAERVYQAFGDGAAPAALNGEKLHDYRVRLMKPYQKHSKAWKSADIGKLPADALDIAETQVFADAYTVAAHPTTGSETGRLRASVSRDAAGRDIHRFHGDPRAAWAEFTLKAKRVTGLTTKFN